jgi:hypothetical protein
MTAAEHRPAQLRTLDLFDLEGLGDQVIERLAG